MNQGLVNREKILEMSRTVKTKIFNHRKSVDYSHNNGIERLIPEMKMDKHISQHPLNSRKKIGILVKPNSIIKNQKRENILSQNGDYLQQTPSSHILKELSDNLNDKEYYEVNKYA